MLKSELSTDFNKHKHLKNAIKELSSSTKDNNFTNIDQLNV